jgi:biopolymer transport protein TolR
MKRSWKKIAPRADINITPFIDILLVLLVIFMTITPKIPAGFHTSVPQQPPPGTQVNNEKVIVLSVDRNGNIRLNQEEIERQSLSGRLQDIFKTRDDRTVFVQADDSLLFNDIAQLLALATDAGVQHIGLMTESISAK